MFVRLVPQIGGLNKNSHIASTNTNPEKHKKRGSYWAVLIFYVFLRSRDELRAAHTPLNRSNLRCYRPLIFIFFKNEKLNAGLEYRGVESNHQNRLK